MPHGSVDRDERSQHDPDYYDHHRDHDLHHPPEEGIGLWARLRHGLAPHSQDHGEAIRAAEEAAEIGIRAAWVSLAGMLGVAVAQVAIIAISGSLSLLADTLHSLGHLVTTIPLIIAFRIGRRPPNKRYPYGYRRGEDLAGLFIALVIAVSAALIIGESIRALVDPRPLTNLGWVLAAGLVGAAGNEIVALYRMRAGRKIGSAALIAEGRHARADGLTSLAVVVGVVGVWLGFPEADAAAGLLIAGMVLWILVVSTRDVSRRLLDGVDHGLVESIEERVAAVPGVEAVESVRARWLGHRLEAEVEIKVDATIPMTSAEHISDQAKAALLEEVAHLDRVTVSMRSDHGRVGTPQAAVPDR